VSAKKAAIKRKLHEKEPQMKGKGRRVYGGAVLTRPKLEKRLGKALSRLSGVK
jgi:hypothetical protein